MTISSAFSIVSAFFHPWLSYQLAIFSEYASLAWHPKDLIKYALKNIIKKKDGKYNFIDYIRNYANKLDKYKNKFLIKSGVDKKNIYNIVPTDKDYKKILQKISDVFNNIIAIK